jgi:uncharacterized membrane protein SirB2
MVLVGESRREGQLLLRLLALRIEFADMIHHELMQFFVHRASKRDHVHEVNDAHLVTIVCKIVKTCIVLVHFDLLEVIALSLPDEASTWVLEKLVLVTAIRGTVTALGHPLHLDLERGRQHRLGMVVLHAQTELQIVEETLVLNLRHVGVILDVSICIF